MASFTMVWAYIAVALIGSAFLLICAYMVGEEYSARNWRVEPFKTGRTAKSVTRLVRMVRMNQAGWQLPGARLDTRYCKVETGYSRQFHSVIRKIAS
jgi:hypothetical protein